MAKITRSSESHRMAKITRSSESHCMALSHAMTIVALSLALTTFIN